MIRVSGDLDGADDVDTVTSAIAFVPPDDDLVIDLRDVQRFDGAFAQRFCEGLVQRRACAETVVVSDRPQVSMHLVLREVDRVAPIVPSVTDAVAIIRSRSGLDLVDAVEVA